MDRQLQIATLIALRIKGTISDDQEKVLQGWISENGSNKELLDRLLSNEYLLQKYDTYQLANEVKSWNALAKLLPEAKEHKLIPIRFLKYAASVVVPLMIISGLAYFFKGSFNDSLANIDEVIQPGAQRAELRLSDGRIVELDNEAPATTLNEAGTTVTNKNNALTYINEEERTNAQPLIYNEIVTPRGGNYNITLADGSNVWLNAASTLRYPVAFTDSTREVYLSGEAYFDVSHDVKPFIVNADKMDIMVLGTTFNVSAYPEALSLSTTLVTGSVKLTTIKGDRILKPKQQGLLTHGIDQLKVEEVNTNLYTSWVNGKIEFEQEDLDGVMRRLSRWYDFEYIFKNEEARNFHFTGRIDNTESISSILHMLELTTNVKFELKETTIVIL